MAKKQPYILVGLAAFFLLLDLGSKWWAHTHLSPMPITVIPNFCHMLLCKNTGGSNGIPSQYMEFCLALPAFFMFMLAAWMGRRARLNRPITPLMYLGFGLFVGGSLGNWTERVLYGGVTDFIHLQWFDFCIFNLADTFIDCGNLLMIFEVLRLWRSGQLKAQPQVAVEQADPPDDIVAKSY